MANNESLQGPSGPEYGALVVNVRKSSGKGVARELRRTGFIPAVVYGGGGENLPLSLDPQAFRRATDPARQWNTLYQLTIKEEGESDRLQPVVLTDVQLDSVRREVIHLDFLRVDEAKEVVRPVPVSYTGRSVGVVKGGRLKTFRRSLKVAALPKHLPVEVVVDVTPVDGGESLRIKDIVLENARIVEDPEQRLVFVDVPKAKKAEEEDPKKKAPAGKKK